MVPSGVRIGCVSMLSAAVMLCATAVAIGDEPAVSPSRKDAICALVPSDVLGAYWLPPRGEEADSAQSAAGIHFAGYILDQAQAMGLFKGIGSKTRVWVDALASVPMLLEYSHAVALFDLRATQLPGGGHRLAGLKAAVIIDVDGREGPIVQRIQHLLTTYTNSDYSQITPVEVAGFKIHRLTDSRLPGWAVVSWGSIGEHYIIALGEGVAEQILTTKRNPEESLAFDKWFRKAQEIARIEDPLLNFTIDFARLTSRIDSSLAIRIAQVKAAVHLASVDRLLYLIGRRGRAIEARGLLRRLGHNELVPLAGMRFISEEEDRWIPKEASFFAAIRCRPQRLVGGVIQAYMATLRPPEDQKAREVWTRVEQEAQLDIEQDLLAHLGNRVIVHDYPKSAFGMPFAWTVMIRIDGNPRTVRRSIDRLLTFSASAMDQSGPLKLIEDTDGIWFLQVGLNGPAVGVEDKWIIFSFSPHAVRTVMNFVLTQSKPEPQPPSS